MNLNRLYKERSRVQQELEASPLYQRFRKLNDAITLIEELDGGQTARTKAETTVKRFRALVDRKPDPLQSKAWVPGLFPRVLVEYLLHGPQPIGSITSHFRRPGASYSQDGSRVHKALRFLRRIGAVERRETEKGYEFTAHRQALEMIRTYFASKRPGRKPKADTKTTRALEVPETVPDALKQMALDVPLRQAILMIAQHTEGGSLDHYAGLLVGLGRVENDSPRRRVGIVIRNMQKDHLLKAAGDGWVLSRKGQKLLNGEAP
jgi:hypothetical protein